MGSAFSYLQHSVTEITDIIFEHERQLEEMDIANLESTTFEDNSAVEDPYF